MRTHRFLLLILAVPVLAFSQTSWKGTTSADWSNSKNWTQGVPTPASDAYLGDSNFTGTFSPKLSSQSTCRSLTVGGTKAITFALGDKNLTVAGNVTIASNGSVTHGKGTLSLQGDWLNNGSYAATRNQSTAYFSGTATQAIGGSATTTFRKVTVGKTSTLKCLQNFIVNGGGANIFVNGTLDPGNFQITGGAPLTVNAGGLLLVSKPTFSGNFGTTGAKTLNAGSTVNYLASGAQTVDQSILYGNLALSNNGTKSAGGNISVQSNLAVNPGATFNGGTFTMTIAGNLSNSGTFNANAGTVALSGPSNTTVTGQWTFNILTVNKTSSTIGVTLTNDISVATLNMTVGTMLTGNNSLTITSTRSGAGIVLGNIVRQHSFSNAIAYAFEGPNNTITFAGSSGITSVLVSVVQTPPADFPSGVSINRRYTIKVPGGSYASATLRLHYLDNELNANTESSLVPWHQDSVWNQAGKAANDSVNNWVEQSGLSTVVGNWTLSSFAGPNVVRWNGSSSGTWEDSSNWSVVSGTPGRPPTTSDMAELGTSAFLNNPTISSAASIRGVSFGSNQAVTLSIAPGGSLQTTGNISGIWTGSSRHAIQLGSQSLSVYGDLVLGDGSPGHAIDLTIGSGSATIQQSLIQTGGANVTFTGAGQLMIGGDYVLGQGGFSAGTGTVAYNGAGSQKIAGGIVYNMLSVNKAAGIAAVDTMLSVNGDLSIAGGTLQTSAPMNVGGNLAIGAAASLDGSFASISVGGNWVRNGLFVPGSGEVMLDGNGAQSIDATAFTNLTITKPSGTATLAGNLTMNGNLTIIGGTLNLLGFTANDNTGSNTLTLSGGSTLQIGGAGNFPSNYAAISIAPSSTVEYNGAGAQNIDSTVTFGNLTVTNASVKSLLGGTSVTGSLLINPGATLDAVSALLEVQGNWINQGSFSASAGTVLFDGLSAQIIGGADTTTFYDLVMSNAGGAVIAASPVISDTLSLVVGNIVTGNRAVCLAATAGIARTSGHIVGNLKKTFTTGIRAFTFTLGDTSSYAPASVSNLNVVAAGSLTASVTGRESPAIASSSVDINKDVNRYWTLTGGDGLVAPAHDVQFTFVPADIDPGAIPAQFIVERFNGVRWDSTTRGTATDTTIQVLQDSLFGDYAVGERRQDSLLAFSVNTGWNLLSLPLLVADPRVSSLCPVGRSTLAYRYNGAYQIRDSMFAGTGYWIKFTGPNAYAATGIPVVSETLQIVTGWNMIGSVIGSVPTSSIISQPPSITTSPFYRYDGVYKVVDTLERWRGYWIKAKQPGTFIISSGPLNIPGAGRIAIVADNDPPPSPPHENPDPDSQGNREGSRIPGRFSLGQNYPNPFNPVTVIRYELPLSVHVTLRISDILGREIATLVDGEQAAGYKSVTWDAAAAPSGLYFCRLTAGNFTDVKKLLLAK